MLQSSPTLYIFSFEEHGTKFIGLNVEHLYMKDINVKLTGLIIGFSFLFLFS